GASDHGRRGEHGHTTHATCSVLPNTQRNDRIASNITGQIRLRRQRGNGTELMLDLQGFPTNRKGHGIHVHQFGDLIGSCETLGGHFNPHNMKHGSHAGDLGNFRPSASGVLRQTLSNVPLSLHGDHSIIGRSIV
uniref:extracellular superoxide dismutase [Cu-Zn]-like n=1 Tax=Pristiophorus japonicus TaxID=55135 RepID=UPI00398E73A2